MLQWIIGIWVSHGQVLWQWICCCVLWENTVTNIEKHVYWILNIFLEELLNNHTKKNIFFSPHIFNSTMELCTDTVSMSAMFSVNKISKIMFDSGLVHGFQRQLLYLFSNDFRVLTDKRYTGQIIGIMLPRPLNFPFPYLQHFHIIHFRGH